VAGHTYGSPTDTLPGLHSPFVNDFSFIRSISNIEFGVFTGDIVYRSEADYWQKVDEQIEVLKVPVYFTAGNHDEGQKPLYQQRYGKTYYRFYVHNDLFVVLDPGLHGWNIKGDQLDFLKEALENSNSFDQVFIFMHHVLWWEERGKYPDLIINSLDGRATDINFFSAIEPMLRKVDKPIYIFTGDVGATPEQTSFFYDHYDNITLVASGMGNMIQDNYLLVDVGHEKNVSLSIRWIKEKTTVVIKDLIAK
jgi:predicted phosphodiesterase